jgi:membrane-bound ClpP family serine protease
MRDVLVVIGLQLLGVVVLLAEFVVPSAGILTVASLVSFGFSLYWMWTNVSAQATVLLGVADLVLVPILAWIGVRIIARSPASLRSELSRTTGTVSQDPILSELVGKTGTTQTALRPSGRAIIDGRRRDVVSSGDYLDANTEVFVSEVSGNRIVVKRKQS